MRDAYFLSLRDAPTSPMIKIKVKIKTMLLIMIMPEIINVKTHTQRGDLLLWAQNVACCITCLIRLQQSKLLSLFAPSPQRKTLQPLSIVTWREQKVKVIFSLSLKTTTIMVIISQPNEWPDKWIAFDSNCDTNCRLADYATSHNVCTSYEKCSSCSKNFVIAHWFQLIAWLMAPTAFTLSETHRNLHSLLNDCYNLH